MHEFNKAINDFINGLVKSCTGVSVLVLILTGFLVASFLI